jgi:hypothetical protein
VSEAPGPAGDGGEPRPLRTDARPLAVHWLVDAAVAFLATIIVGLVLGASFWAMLVAAVVLGGVAAPFTRRVDERGVAARQQR